MAFKPLVKSYSQAHFKHIATKIKKKKGKARREKQKVQIIINKKNDRCCAHKREGERHVEKKKQK